MNNEKTTNQDVDFSIAEKWNGIAAIVGCVAAFASYSFTGQLIPGLVSVSYTHLTLPTICSV